MPNTMGTFKFNGKSLPLLEGRNTVAETLFHHGERHISNSIKYHRPRGAYCFSGHCDGCLVEIKRTGSQEMNVRACQCLVDPGIEVFSQNRGIAMGDTQVDPIRLSDWFHETYMDHHRMFAWNKWVNRLALRVIRQFAGLGRVQPQASVVSHAHRSMYTDVLVLGKGVHAETQFKTLVNEGRDVKQVEYRAVAAYRKRNTEGESGAIELVIQTPTGIMQVACNSLHAVQEEHVISPRVPGGDAPGVISHVAACRLIKHGISLGKRVFVYNESALDIDQRLRSFPEINEMTVVTYEQGHLVLEHAGGYSDCDTLIVQTPLVIEHALLMQLGAKVAWEASTSRFEFVKDIDGCVAENVWVIS